MELSTRNVNTAFKRLVEYFDGQRDVRSEPPPVRKESRNGPVRMIEEPVLVTYSHPRERVLFNAARDANPAFHLYEALWMLAGRNDLAPVAYYASNMANYSDDGKTLNGAYGYRWRNAFESSEGGGRWETDQLNIIVDHLKADPTSRRVVLQMWNVEDDLLKIGANPDKSSNFYHPNLNFPPSKDVCCNLSVMFSLRPCTSCDGSGVYRGRYTPDDPNSPHVEEPCENHETFLDMTVTNRSNDMIWGMLGANYVHFTVLQEYMAARLGIEVGKYHHFSNNLHVYESNWKPKEWLGYRGDYKDPYVGTPFPLVSNVETFERELPLFVEHHSGKLDASELENQWTEPFLATVAGPMLCAFACHKEKDYHGALILCDQIEADDWKAAATAWIQRRINKKGVTG